MKLLLIGNGFDRAHGLPTNYWDFRSFLNRMHPEFLMGFEEHYQIYLGTSDEEKQSMLWNRFETNLANIDEDIIISDGVSIDLALESGDVGIEDTMYDYLSKEYEYIGLLSHYLKEWVRTIRIKDCLPRTSKICRSNGDFYVSFNYTATLENVYTIPENDVLHIHGSLRDYTHDPIIGHGNLKRIQDINSKISEAERLFDEKWSSVCKVVRDYYITTFKDVNKYIPSLSRLTEKNFDEIIVLGLSIEGVDLPYFKYIDTITGNKLEWKIYCYHEDEGEIKKNNLVGQGILPEKLALYNSTDFFDLQDNKMARDYLRKQHYDF